MKRITIMAAALTGLFYAQSVAAEPYLIRSNVATCEGVSASGFKVIGGTIQNFVSTDAAARHEFCQDVTVVPASVDVYSLAEVQEYLGAIGITDARPFMRGGNEYCPVEGYNVDACPTETKTSRVRW